MGRTIAGVMLVLGACSHELEGYVLPPAPALALEPPRQVFVVGETAAFALVAVEDDVRDPVAGSITWRASADTVEVERDPATPGFASVTAVAPATATITATISGVATTGAVLAVPHAVTAVALEPPALSLRLGGAASLAAIATLAAPVGSPDEADVTTAALWASDVPAVLDVEDGVVRRIGAGTARVTATVITPTGMFNTSLVVTE